MRINMRQMRAFAALAKHRSFTKAAEELHLTQPAISMQIKQLEAEAGIPLLERSGRKIYLTEAGEQVYSHARAIAEHLDNLSTSIDSLKGLEGGKLRISAATTANYFVPILLSIFHERYPGAEVSLDVTNRQTLLQQLADNETDMVIMGVPPGEMDLTAGAFMENPLHIIAPPDYPLANSKNVSLRQMDGETFLVREPGSGTRKAMERFFKNHNVTYRTGMEVASDEAIKQSVQAGLGLGFMSKDAVQMEMELGRLVILDVEQTPLRRQWYAVHREGKSLSPLAGAFKAFLLEEAAEVLGRERG